MSKLDYIAIDFETANQFKNSACSIGLVRFIDGKEAGSVSQLIHPAKMYFIQEWTDQIHHISYKDVENMPYFPEVWNTIAMPFINETPGLPLVAHNGNTFDMNVIRGCCDYFNMDYPNLSYFDSLYVAQKTWPEFESHKLTFLGENFGIDYLAHDALEDSRTCGIVIAKAAEKHGVDNIPDLLKACNLKMNSFYN